MNLFRFLSSQKCPRCDHRFSKEAHFCSRCGYGNPREMRSCTACGVEVGADSQMCWNCGVDLTSQLTDALRGGVWRREHGQIAVRIALQYPGRVLESGVEVADGTEGFLYVNGCFAKALRGGFSKQAPDRSLLDRLFALEGGRDRVEAILVPSHPFEVPVQMHHPAPLSNGTSLQASLVVSLKIAEASKIHSRLLYGRDLLTTADLESELLAYCTRALGAAVDGMSDEEILAKRHDVGFFEVAIKRALEGSLDELGLAFVSLRDISILGDGLDATMRAKVEKRLRDAEWEEQFRDLRDRTEFEKFRSKMEHQSRLGAMEWREIELLFEARMASNLREVERPAEIAEAEHGEELKGIKRAGQIKGLDDLREHGSRSMRDLLEVKKEKDRLAREHEEETAKIRIESQIKLAKSLDGLSREAILASAGREVRADLVALSAADKAGPAISIPAPSGSMDCRNGSVAIPGAPTVDGKVLERQRRAVGLLYAATGNFVHACFGTVWAMEKNRVVSNAHVAAEAMQYLDKNIGLWVRFSAGDPLAVERLKIHPRFRDHVSRFGGKEHAIPECDLAILDLLGECDFVLPRRSGRSVEGLEVGDAVHYIGFPGEGVPGGGLNPAAPSPLYKPGSISNLTDFSYGAVTPADARLITFDAGVAGGASGSPLLDLQGNVVGVVSAGTMHSVGGGHGAYPDERFERIASGSLVNFAQRIDLLEELL